MSEKYEVLSANPKKNQLMSPTGAPTLWCTPSTTFLQYSAQQKSELRQSPVAVASVASVPHAHTSSYSKEGFGECGTKQKTIEEGIPRRGRGRGRGRSKVLRDDDQGMPCACAFNDFVVLGIFFSLPFSLRVLESCLR